MNEVSANQSFDDYGYGEQGKSSENPNRHSRSISLEESRNFIIDIDKVEQDGRLTVMVRNIPVKYTQDMLF